MQLSLPLMAEHQTNLTNLQGNRMVNFITGANGINKMNKSGLDKMFQEAKEYYESFTR